MNTFTYEKVLEYTGTHEMIEDRTDRTLNDGLFMLIIEENFPDREGDFGASGTIAVKNAQPVRYSTAEQEQAEITREVQDTLDWWEEQ